MADESATGPTVHRKEFSRPGLQGAAGGPFIDERIFPWRPIFPNWLNEATWHRVSQGTDLSRTFHSIPVISWVSLSTIQ